ncbi:DUF3089 domain-containing protein [Winogradskyella echinorum]|uniref:DUF3089 domain-containing protein n=1 Tax=Winogradskyella echinorum TaxID=538189 RepID=A0ABR6Y2L0_9FLAO|nr:DUF3089 domain-containing protein [Winogradskyella echinorum]MBC3846976.1 DUF3089 domain-containing protein [Winogradskyella echinorum]MBC5751324.1 DUF3089 domain-containing protein [Winogradskyella echinorum]
MKYRNIILLFCFIILANCSKDSDDSISQSEQRIEIPLSTVDYSSMDNWVFHPNKPTFLTNYNLDIAVINENLQIENIIPITNNSYTDTGIDVFFVHPTVLTQNEIPEYIDIQDQPELLITGTIVAQGALLSKYGRLFAPRYRQSTGRTYRPETDKETQASIIAVSYSDIKAAFLDYLNNHNNGNKIIIAGHSQGSYLLAMLLRDVIDSDENLRSKLITAALAGMDYLYASENSYLGGWWQNIPLCTTTNECGCVHNWTSFDESQSLPEIDYAMPQFNPYLINSGLVYRTFNESEDWFIQDFSFYDTQTQPLRYYIVPDANYNLSAGNNFIAFDNLYNVRHKRDGLTKVALSLAHNPEVNDMRPNDLANEVFHPNYSDWGYHIKDYHIYLWALMQQIDLKINNCQ